MRFSTKKVLVDVKISIMTFFKMTMATNGRISNQFFVNNVRSIIEQGRKMAYATAEQAYLTFSNWEILHELVQNLTRTHLRRIFVSKHSRL